MTAPPHCTQSLALLSIVCTGAPTMFWGICWHSCKIQFGSCCTVTGIGSYTLDFRYPQSQKSQGVRSGLLGGHSTAALKLLITFPGKCCSNKALDW